MKSSIVLSFAVLATLMIIPGNSQDKPDGFASVNGKGLSTTTGGAGGETVTVSTFDDLKRYAAVSEPYTILVDGTITPPNKGDAVNVTSNKTIVGLGDDATLYQIELHIILQRNIIIRNIINRDSYVEGNWDCKDTDWDGIQADSCHQLWIDHCWFTHNCDGLIDLRKSCDYVTVSWVHLSNHNKAFGIGWTENTDFRMTIHHCWFDNTNQRNPSFDMGMGHLYNNYISDIASYGNLARGKARVIIENSFYEDSNNPVQISDEAILYVSGLQFTGCSGSTSGNTATPPFDINQYYTYTLDETSEVKRVVTAGVGPKTEIGEQYTGTTGTVIRHGALPTTAILDVFPVAANDIRIHTTFPGRQTIVILTAKGRIINSFHRNGPSTVRCALPSGGMYIVSVIDGKSGETVRSLLFPHGNKLNVHAPRGNQ